MRLLLLAFLVLGSAASLAAQGKALKSLEFELGLSAVQQQAVGAAADRNVTAGRAAAITKHLCTKMALTIRYQHLPDPGFLPTDRLFATGIQVTSGDLLMPAGDTGNLATTVAYE